MNLWLIGAGQMAQDYFKVLNALDVSFEVIGRGFDSASNYLNSTGQKVQTGGVAEALKCQKAPDTAIVAVGVAQLAEVASILIKLGTRRILLEKPGGLNFEQIQNLNNIAIKHDANVWLAYNRRFYASTFKAEEIISEDKEVSSVHFEFTEWSHKISDMDVSSEVKEHWFLANSSHVVDLVFHMCGTPKDWCPWFDGSLDWHHSASRFAGSGLTNKGALFSYIADWEAPGSWGIELLTRKHRLILRPMEELKLIQLGSLDIELIKLDDTLDKQFKPGLFLQTEAFLKRDTDRLCSLKQQVDHTLLYYEIAGYGFSNSEEKER